MDWRVWSVAGLYILWASFVMASIVVGMMISVNGSVPTVSNVVVARLVEGWRKSGCSDALIARHMGKHYDKLAKRLYRVPVADMTAIFLGLADDLSDPLFGLRSGQCINVARLGVISNLLIYASTVEMAIKSIMGISSLFSQGVRFQLSTEKEWAVLAVDINPLNPVSYHQIDAFVMVIVNLLYTVLPKHSVEVQLTHDGNDRREEYGGVLSAGVSFGRSRNCVLFPAHFLAHSVPWSDVNLFDVCHEIAQKEYRDFQNTMPLPEFVKSYIKERIVEGEPDQQEIAKVLNLGVRSFQLKLRQHDVKFRDLVLESKKEAALTLLRDNRYTSERIAVLLGFDEVSGFYRSFKRWTGLSVLDYVGYQAK